MIRRVVGQRNQLMASLAESQKQCKLESADQEPDRVRYGDGEGARCRPEDKSTRNREHIDQDVMLQGEGIGDLKEQITGRHNPESEIDQIGNGGPADS